MKLISFIADPQGIAAIAYEGGEVVATLTAYGPNRLEDAGVLQRLTEFCRGRGKNAVTDGAVTGPILSALKEGGVRSIVQVAPLCVERRRLTVAEYAMTVGLQRPREASLYPSDGLLSKAAVVARVYMHARE